ncbi:MAG: F0F1 ATP synthase subunit epsilon [Phycisphaerales bacterium]|nr:F0F1 ATP synthase subunit epsilon [Phycisphaerales bacterium]
MKLTLLTPQKKNFEGTVAGVLLPGQSGLFEILNDHAPIVSSLKSGIIKIILPDQKKISFQSGSGFVKKTKDNTINILVESATELS